jgi:hypothetical protein
MGDPNEPRMIMNTLGRLVLLAALAAASAAVGGCKGTTDTRPQRVPVTGKVLHKDQPVEGATVIFEPVGSTPAATGQTDAAGRFQLTTFDPNDGAVAGEYKVAVQKIQVTRSDRPANAPDDAPAPPPEEKSLLPVKYARGDTSGLTATVKSAGPNDFTFELRD